MFIFLTHSLSGVCGGVCVGKGVVCILLKVYKGLFVNNVIVVRFDKWRNYYF